MGNICRGGKPEQVVRDLLSDGIDDFGDSKYHKANMTFTDAIEYCTGLKWVEESAGMITLAHVYHRRGMCNQKLKRFNEALDDFSEGIILSKRASELWLASTIRYFKGSLLREMGELSKALEELRKAKKEDPSKMSLFSLCSRVYSELGDYASAVHDFKVVEKSAFVHQQGSEESVYELAKLLDANEEWKKCDLVKEEDVDRIIRLAKLWKDPKSKEGDTNQENFDCDSTSEDEEDEDLIVKDDGDESGDEEDDEDTLQIE